jgi:hypothetical protein
MISIVLKNGQPDTASSPFYDYQRDSIYVGDDNGTLHKIINAFGLWYWYRDSRDSVRYNVECIRRHRPRDGNRAPSPFRDV